MKVRKRHNHSRARFWTSTVAAQVHLFGVVSFLLGGVILVPLAWARSVGDFVSALSFIMTGLLVFTVSTTYHFLHDGFETSERLAALLEDLDHYSIYLFIAGTYSPFLWNAIEPPWRGYLLTLVWMLALLGVLYTGLKPRLPKLLQHRMVYTGLFVMMGWVIVGRGAELVATLSTERWIWLLGGGAAYSIGAVIYAIKRPILIPGFFAYHELWHLLVLIGAGLHYGLILSYYV